MSAQLLRSSRPLGSCYSTAAARHEALPRLGACASSSIAGGSSRRLVVSRVGDHLHIDENTITMGSAAVSLGLPFLYTQLRTRVKEVQLSDICKPGSIVLDVRTNAQRAEQGLPVLPEGVTIVHAPWMVQSGAYCKLNPHFSDDVMFASKDATARTPLVIMDMCGECGPAAAREVSKLGTVCKVKLAVGGLKAWQNAGHPMVGLVEPEAINHTIDAEDLLCELEDPPAEPAIFKPKLIEVLESGYSVAELKQDVMAGMVVGVIALSLSMALGIASESTPAIGLTTAVVSGFLISVLGGSRVSIGGPTAAFIPIVVGVAHQYGVENLVVCTGLSGLMLVAMGLTGLGRAISFIPKPVVAGFTAGIATYIFSTQIKDFLGLGVPGALPEGEAVPSQFLEKLWFLGSHIDGTHLPSLALASSALALTLAWPKPWAKVLPPQIVTVVAATAGLAAVDYAMHGSGSLTATATATAAAAFGIETIGSHFGANAIPSSLPMPHLPAGLTDPKLLGELVQPALGIALLGSIESLLCARVADTMIGDKHNPNTELIAQGVANIASAAVGGLPATGALARTAANVRSGGRSPIAGMVHAATILAVMMVASPLAAYIPLPALSAVLVVVAINMGEWRHFWQLPTWPEKDAQLFLLAFFLTVMQDVTVAVELGMAAAVLLYVRDVTNTLSVQALEEGEELNLEGAKNKRGRGAALPRGLYRSPERQLSPGAASLAATTWAVGPVPLTASPTPPPADDYYDAADSVEFVGDSVMAAAAAAAIMNGGGNTSGGAAAEGRRVTRLGETTSGEDDDDDGGLKANSLQVPAGVAYLDVTGSLLFGAGHQLEQACGRLLSKRGTGGRAARVLVLGMRHLSTCDVSGLEVLEELAKSLHRNGVPLILVGPSKQPLQMMARAGFLHEIGSRNVCRTLEAGFERAEQLLQEMAATPSSSHSGNGTGAIPSTQAAAQVLANNVVGAPVRKITPVPTSASSGGFTTTTIQPLTPTGARGVGMGADDSYSGNASPSSTSPSPPRD